MAPSDAEPDAAVDARETIELAFLAAIQHLPLRQRAVLILRDVLGWSAKETATLLESSVASVNSALQRARPTARAPAGVGAVLGSEPGGARGAAALHGRDRAGRRRRPRRRARTRGSASSREPAVTPGRSRPSIRAGDDCRAWAPALDGPGAVEIRLVPTRANRQPAVGTYVRVAGGSKYRAFGLAVLRVEDGAVAEVTVFVPDLFPAFGLPLTRR